MLRNRLKSHRGPCSARGPVGRAGVAVVLASLTLAPAAFANGWSLQFPPNQPGTNGGVLNGVSCATGNDCWAVGSSTNSNTGGPQLLRFDHYNGSSWTVPAPAVPGPAASVLYGVSCPSSSFCMAVGSTSASGATLPLVFTYNGVGWTQIGLPLTPGEQIGLKAVSCPSTSFCMLAGSFVASDTPPAVFTWNGSTFKQQQTNIAFQPGEFDSVSCTSAAFCALAGQAKPSAASLLPAAGFWNGSGLSADAPRSPVNSTYSHLTGVSCVSTNDCQAVGNTLTPSGSLSTFGASYNGSSWTLQSTPPNPASGLFGEQRAGACANASFCWAVGEYTDANHIVDPLGDFWDGTGWTLGLLPRPSGSFSFLQSVSCPTQFSCLAVGYYKPSTSAPVEPLAEQGSFSVLVGCCRRFTPHHFALKVSGLEKRGATIIAQLKKPKVLELLVERLHKSRLIILGLVPLGNHPAGISKIRWNLRVNGKPLGKGTYKVTLSSVIGSILSPPTPPGEITLIINPNGHLKVEK